VEIRIPRADSADALLGHQDRGVCVMDQIAGEPRKFANHKHWLTPFHRLIQGLAISDVDQRAAAMEGRERCKIGRFFFAT
jgi:hypothetical protein